MLAQKKIHFLLECLLGIVLQADILYLIVFIQTGTNNLLLLLLVCEYN